MARINGRVLFAWAALVACQSVCAQPCDDSLFLPVTPLLLEHGPASNEYRKYGASAVGDLNGDGWPDLVGAGDRTLRVFLSDGVGGFHPEVMYSLEPEQTTRSYEPLVADFDGDGVDEIAAEIRQGPSPYVTLTRFFEVAGDGVSLTPALADITGYTRLAGDFNTDGFADLVSHEGTRLNDGMGGFLPPVPLVGGGFGGVDAQLLDFNSDGLLDVLSLGATNKVGTMFVHHGRADGSFELARSVPSPLGSRTLTAGDLNKDGLFDLVIMRHKPDDDLGVRLAMNETQWGGWQYTDNGTLADNTPGDTVRLIDVSGDGVLDVVFNGAFNWHNMFGPNVNAYFLGVRVGDGAGGFGAPVGYYLSDQTVGLETRGRRDLFVRGPILFADTDLDGASEIVFTMLGEGGVFYTAIAEIGCRERDLGDYNDDGLTNATDLATLLAGWGTDGADLDDDGTTNATDLAILLAAWGSVFD